MDVLSGTSLPWGLPAVCCSTFSLASSILPFPMLNPKSLQTLPNVLGLRAGTQTHSWFMSVVTDLKWIQRSPAHFFCSLVSVFFHYLRQWYPTFSSYKPTTSPLPTWNLTSIPTHRPTGIQTAPVPRWCSGGRGPLRICTPDAFPFPCLARLKIFFSLLDPPPTWSVKSFSLVGTYVWVFLFTKRETKPKKETKKPRNLSFLKTFLPWWLHFSFFWQRQMREKAVSTRDPFL